MDLGKDSKSERSRVMSAQPRKKEEIRKGDILFFPCKVSDFSPYEVVISLDPPKPAYKPNINGFITRKDVFIDGEPVPDEVGNNKEGFVKALVVNPGASEVNVFINGHLSHSPPFCVPKKYMRERGIL